MGAALGVLEAAFSDFVAAVSQYESIARAEAAKVGTGAAATVTDSGTAGAQVTGSGAEGAQLTGSGEEGAAPAPAPAPPPPPPPPPYRPQAPASLIPPVDIIGQWPLDQTGNIDLYGIQGNNFQLSQNFNDQRTRISQILTNQSQVSNIVNTELERLKDKKTSVDQAIIGQQRIVTLNDNYRQRYAQYINIIVVICITLVLIIGLITLENTFTFIPSYVFETLMAFIFIGGLYLCYVFYSLIQSRSNMDFNKLNLPGPVSLSPAQLEAQKQAAAKSGNLLGTINLYGCIGPECCGNNTQWDSGNSICLPNGETYSGFTTMTISYNNINVLPNSPNEYANYMPL
jgi:hypothetical protein